MSLISSGEDEVASANEDKLATERIPSPCWATLRSGMLPQLALLARSLRNWCARDAVSAIILLDFARLLLAVLLPRPAPGQVAMFEDTHAGYLL